MPWSVIGDIAAYQMAGKHVVCFNAGFDVHLMVHLFGRITFRFLSLKCLAQWNTTLSLWVSGPKQKKTTSGRSCLSLLMVL